MPSKKIRDNAKRKTRERAITLNALNDKEYHIDTRTGNRAELFNRQLDVRPVIASITEPQPIYCSKTGALIGETNRMANAMAAQVAEHVGIEHAERSRKVYDSNICHPAWFDTSHDALAALQKLMPHEYCVYVRNLFLKTKASAIDRQEELQALYTGPVGTVIEYAELLRRAMAMFGKYAATCKVLPELPYSTVTAYRHWQLLYSIKALQQWISDAIRKAQYQLHHEDLDRRRVVTLADVQSFQFDLGSRLFREARISKADDDALLIDVAEIFATDDSQMVTAWSYHKPPTAVKEVPFKGRLTGDVPRKPNNNGTVTTESQSIKPIGLF